jgi:hypothetical protein
VRLRTRPGLRAASSTRAPDSVGARAGLGARAQMHGACSVTIPWGAVLELESEEPMELVPNGCQEAIAPPVVSVRVESHAGRPWLTPFCVETSARRSAPTLKGGSSKQNQSTHSVPSHLWSINSDAAGPRRAHTGSTSRLGAHDTRHSHPLCLASLRFLQECRFDSRKLPPGNSDSDWSPSWAGPPDPTPPWPARGFTSIWMGPAHSLAVYKRRSTRLPGSLTPA